MKLFLLVIVAGLFVAPGETRPKNMAQAVAQWRQAAEAGSPESQRMLGWAYRKGKGVRKDLDQAVSWYKKAAENGDSGAKQALEEIEERQAYRQLQVNTPLNLCHWTGGTPYCHP
jgi:TPR repeat protein